MSPGAPKERGYEAHALRFLGEVAAQRQPPQVAQAEAYYRQALALAEELGMRPLQAHCHRRPRHAVCQDEASRSRRAWHCLPLSTCTVLWR